MKTDFGGKDLPLFDKCREFTAYRDSIEAGIYPYFHELQSGQAPEVVMEGKRRIMLGSNNYLGLTSHPDVIRAGVQALEKYGSGCSGSRFLNGNLDLHNILGRSWRSSWARRPACFCPRASEQSWHYQRGRGPARLYPERPRKPRQHLRRLRPELAETVRSATTIWTTWKSGCKSCPGRPES